MPRRPRGDGSVSARPRTDGRFSASLSLGIVDGKRRRRTVYGKTRREASEKLARLKVQLAKGQAAPTGRMRLRDYLATWLERKRSEIRASTWDNYEAALRLHVVPLLGATPLSRLSADSLTALQNDVRARRSAGTAHNVGVILLAALNDAVADELIPPFPKRRRRAQEKSREMRPLAREEVGRFLDAATGDPYRLLFLAAIGTGMRLGELRALRWRDLDLERGWLVVQRTLGRHGFGPPKSGRGRRILLSPSLVVELRCQAPSGPVGEDALVFERGFGLPVAQNTARDHLRAVLKRAELPRIRFHDLRHTAATLMLEAGVALKQVSEMLGHSSPMVTATIYAHVTEAMHQQAAQAMESVLSGAYRSSEWHSNGEEARQPNDS